MGLFSSIKKVVGGAAKIALPAAGAYFGGNALFSPSMLGSTNVLNGSLSSLAPSSLFSGIGFGDILSAGGAYGSYLGQQSINSAQMGLARDQMDFQERMSNTAVQRHVADLKAAGLNPMLGYNGQASSPSGAMATLGNSTQSAINTGMALKAQQSQLANIDADTALKGVTALKTMQEERTSAATAQSIYQQMLKTQEETRNINMDTVLKSVSINKVQAEVNEVISRTGLNLEQRKLVEQEIENAIKTGGEILARTSNHEANTALTKIKSRLETLAIPRATREADMYNGSFGAMVPYVEPVTQMVNSASGAIGIKNLLDFFKGGKENPNNLPPRGGKTPHPSSLWD